MGVAALYPHFQPPQNGNILSSNPLQVIPSIIALKQLQSQQAVGQAFQAGVGPNGEFDPSVTSTAIANNPNAALAAPEAISRNLAARAQNIGNATAAVGLATSQNAGLASYLSSFAGKNLTMQDVQNIKAGAMRIPGADPTVFGAITTPQQMQEAIKNATIHSAGAATAINPTGVAPSPDLTPNVAPGAAAFRGPGAAAAAARPVGAAPTAVADNQAYIADKTATPEFLKSIRPAQQALGIIGQLGPNDFGKASPMLASVKSALVTAGIMDANATTLPSREEFGKYLNQLANQLPHASDMGLTQNKLSSPNTDLTQPANISLLKNAIAMSRMDAAAPSAIGGAADYQNKKSAYYASQDPLAFQIDMMSPTEIKNLQASLKGADRNKFNNSLAAAIKAGVITPQLKTPGQ